MKILCITHSEDMDGILCGSIIKHFTNGVEIIETDYSNLEYNLSRAILNRHFYDEIIICDICFWKESTQRLLTQLCETGTKVIIFDHHIDTLNYVTNSNLDIECYIATHNVDICVSASFWVAWYYAVKIKQSITQFKLVDELIKAVSDWDTLQWLIDDNNTAKYLQTHTCANGLEWFKSLCIECFTTDEPLTLIELIDKLSVADTATLHSDYELMVKRHSNLLCINSNTHYVVELPDGYDYETFSCFVYDIMETLNIDVVMSVDGNSLRVNSRIKSIDYLLLKLGIPLHQTNPYYCSHNLADCMENLLKL